MLVDTRTALPRTIFDTMSASGDSERLLDVRHPIAEVWKQAWPTVLTMTSYTVMQFVDTLMVARIGHVEVAAQGNGGIWSFAIICFGFGLLSVVNTFVAQHVGAGRAGDAARYGWAAMWIGMVFWAVVLLPWAIALAWIFPYMGHDPALVELELEYAQILLLGGCFLLSAKGLNNWFFGYQRPRVVTIAAIAGNIVNVCANYVLIFGENGVPELALPGVPGMPALGLYGAAWGTVLGTAVELAIPLAFFLGPRINAEIQSRSAWKPDLAAVRSIFRIGWPAGLQIGNEVLCWAFFMTVLVGYFGEDDMSAGWAVMRYLHFSFMPAVGFSVATTSLVGKWIGANRFDLAVSRTRVALLMAVAYMTLCGVLFVIFRYPLISIFIGENVEPEVAAEILRVGGALMICGALFQTMDAVGIVYTGALRGAGDTIWPGFANVVLSWVLLIGGGALLVRLAPELGSVGPWLGALAFIVVYGGVIAWRFERGRWRSIDLLKKSSRSTSGPQGALPGGETRGSVEPIGPED
ncbi:MAG: MATE family efflux transporter [Phycisphaerales bacterium]|nr:MATE family efflux transporter [Phycisphaerales bacterium]